MLVPAAAAASGKLVPTAVLVTTAARFAVTGIQQLTARGAGRGDDGEDVPVRAVAAGRLGAAPADLAEAVDAGHGARRHLALGEDRDRRVDARRGSVRPGEEIVTEEAPERAPVVDLMAALKASVSEAGSQRRGPRDRRAGAPATDGSREDLYEEAQRRGDPRPLEDVEGRAGRGDRRRVVRPPGRCPCAAQAGRTPAGPSAAGGPSGWRGASRDGDERGDGRGEAARPTPVAQRHGRRAVAVGRPRVRSIGNGPPRCASPGTRRAPARRSRTCRSGSGPGTGRRRSGASPSPLAAASPTRPSGC
jgi:hypothetical protein